MIVIDQTTDDVANDAYTNTNLLFTMNDFDFDRIEATSEFTNCQSCWKVSILKQKLESYSQTPFQLLPQEILNYTRVVVRYIKHLITIHYMMTKIFLIQNYMN
jgi:hypothetical protein